MSLDTSARHPPRTSFKIHDMIINPSKRMKSRRVHAVLGRLDRRTDLRPQGECAQSSRSYLIMQRARTPYICTDISPSRLASARLRPTSRMTYMSSVVDVVAIAAIVYVAGRLLSRSKSASPLPPGPSGLPIIGNVLDLPQSEPYKAYIQWGHKYGTCDLQLHHLNLIECRADHARVCAWAAADHRQRSIHRDGVAGKARHTVLG